MVHYLKELANNRMKWIVSLALVLAIVLSMFLWTPSLSMADDDYVIFTKSLRVDKYDKSLPAIPLEKWLTSILPRGIVAVWSETVTDCGEQTGVPEIDKKRNMLLCVEIELREKGKSVGYLLLFVGTNRKGISKEGVSLYYGYIKQGEKNVRLKNLKEIAKMKGGKQSFKEGDSEAIHDQNRSGRCSRRHDHEHRNAFDLSAPGFWMDRKRHSGQT
jgi:hypothetical protein